MRVVHSLLIVAICLAVIQAQDQQQEQPQLQQQRQQQQQQQDPPIMVEATQEDLVRAKEGIRQLLAQFPIQHVDPLVTTLDGYCSTFGDLCGAACKERMTDDDTNGDETILGCANPEGINIVSVNAACHCAGLDLTDRINFAIVGGIVASKESKESDFAAEGLLDFVTFLPGVPTYISIINVIQKVCYYISFLDYLATNPNSSPCVKVDPGIIGAITKLIPGLTGAAGGIGDIIGIIGGLFGGGSKPTPSAGGGWWEGIFGKPTPTPTPTTTAVGWWEGIWGPPKPTPTPTTTTTTTTTTTAVGWWEGIWGPPKPTPTTTKTATASASQPTHTTTTTAAAGGGWWDWFGGGTPTTTTTTTTRTTTRTATTTATVSASKSTPTTTTTAAAGGGWWDWFGGGAPKTTTTTSTTTSTATTARTTTATTSRIGATNRPVSGTPGPHVATLTITASATPSPSSASIFGFLPRFGLFSDEDGTAGDVIDAESAKEEDPAKRLVSPDGRVARIVRVQRREAEKRAAAAGAGAVAKDQIKVDL
ncbi:hypothetical protein BGZ83_007789 [Gryganskiella cystojenkinii]|nr:hypothetical protein BGZ83_007789 [Gryganskiella cystojenkinii]